MYLMWEHIVDIISYIFSDYNKKYLLTVDHFVNNPRQVANEFRKKGLVPPTKFFLIAVSIYAVIDRITAMLGAVKPLPHEDANRLHEQSIENQNAIRLVLKWRSDMLSMAIVIAGLFVIIYAILFLLTKLLSKK